MVSTTGALNAVSFAVAILATFVNLGSWLALSSSNKLLEEVRKLRTPIICLSEFANNLSLSESRALSIALKCCRYPLVTEVLAPSFQLFVGYAQRLAQHCQCVSDAVRVEIPQARGNSDIGLRR